MFVLSEKLMEAIRALTLGYEPAFEGPDILLMAGCKGSCAGTCKSSCRGKCKAACTTTCKGTSKGRSGGRTSGCIRK